MLEKVFIDDFEPVYVFLWILKMGKDRNCVVPIVLESNKNICIAVNLLLYYSCVLLHFVV